MKRRATSCSTPPFPGWRRAVAALPRGDDRGRAGGGRAVQARSRGFRAVEAVECRAAGLGQPWGRGRPGWHIECSAMVEAHLGATIDIHGGGLDLKFPHHENEIAQSASAHEGAPLARFWLHNGFLDVEREKMSKSLGNVVLVRDLLREAPGRRSATPCSRRTTASPGLERGPRAGQARARSRLSDAVGAARSPTRGRPQRAWAPCPDMAKRAMRCRQGQWSRRSKTISTRPRRLPSCSRSAAPPTPALIRGPSRAPGPAARGRQPAWRCSRTRNPGRRPAGPPSTKPRWSA